MSFTDLSQIPQAVQDGVTSPEAERWYARAIEFFRARARSQVGQALRSRHDLTEIAQLAVIRLMSKVGDFKSQGKGSFHAWAHRLLYFAILGVARRRASRIVTGSEGLSGVEAPEPSPEVLVTRKESFASAGKALSLLSEKHKVVINLRNLEELTFPEISERLGLPVSTVTDRYYRGITLMREMMGTPG